MATPGGLVDKQELIDAQLDTAHLGRVVNSKDASGAPISTSTNRTGGVNKTLDALEAEYREAIDNAQIENYAGLWPDTGGSADKGETWQTQVNGTPTGQYFRALQNTTVAPIGNDVNWREVVSARDISDITDDISDITDDIAQNVSTTPPAVPPASSNLKLIMRPYISGSIDYGCYVVSRKSRSKNGYIATRISNSVAAVDSLNTGGDSNFRPDQVINIKECYIACCRAVDKSAAVTLSGLSSTFIDAVWDYDNSGISTEYHSKTSSEEIETRNRELYQIPKNSDPVINNYVEYEVTGDCTIRLGLTASSTPECIIETGFDGSLHEYRTVSLVKSPSTPVSYLDVKIEAPARDAAYKVRISNAWKDSNGDNCYVAGLNLGTLGEMESKLDITSALMQQVVDYNGVANMYRRSTGANEFAAKESGGKFFGTYHGGHTNFIERLRVDDGSNYDMRDLITLPELVVTEHVTLHSQSILTPDSATGSYNYVSETFFYDGFDYTQYSITNRVGFNAVLSDAYTHMCTTNNTFNRIYQPVLHTYTVNEEVLYGNEQTCYQFRDDGASLVSYYSGLNVKNNTTGGGRVSYQSSFAKQYYGPILGVTTEFGGGTFVTAKEYF